MSRSKISTAAAATDANPARRAVRLYESRVRAGGEVGTLGAPAVAGAEATMSSADAMIALLTSCAVSAELTESSKRGQTALTSAWAQITPEASDAVMARSSRYVKFNATATEASVCAACSQML